MFKQAFDYKSWADLRTLEAIETIDKSQFADSYGFVLQQINHMVIVEELFRSRLEHKQAPHSSTNTTLVPELEALKTRLEASNHWFQQFVANANQLDKQIKFIFADGKQGMMTIEEILFHVVNHGTYHRGNIARELDLSSVPHPVDGYGLFIHQKEPERRNV